MGGIVMVGKLVSSSRGATYYWVERNKNPDAPYIVFTHGIAANHHLFDKQLPYFQWNYHMIFWDLPLHGRSRPYHDFSYANAAEELKAILDREKVDTVILVGHGIGGYVCQEFTARWPEKVQAFVGVGAMPLGVSFYSAADLKGLRKVPMHMKRLPKKLLWNHLAKGHAQTRYGYHNALAMVEQMSKREIINAFSSAYGDRFTREEPVDFSCPVLLMIGAMDYTGKIAEYCRIWAEQTGYPMYVIPDASHNANADNCDAFNDVLNKFLHRQVDGK